MSEYMQFIKAQEKRKTIFARYVLISVALFCIVFMLAGCVKNSTQDPELLPYFSAYQRITGIGPWGVGAHFEEKSDNTREMGKCSISWKGREITIYKNYWNNATDSSKEQLMFHELTHCLKGIEHIDGVKSDGCPLSIMNTTHFSDDCYSLHYQEYIDELRRL